MAKAQYRIPVMAPTWMRRDSKKLWLETEARHDYLLASRRLAASLWRAFPLIAGPATAVPVRVAPARNHARSGADTRRETPSSIRAASIACAYIARSRAISSRHARRSPSTDCSRCISPRLGSMRAYSRQ